MNKGKFQNKREQFEERFCPKSNLKTEFSKKKIS